MSIHVLSPSELSERRATAGVATEYVKALATIPAGSGGEVDIAEEGIGRESVKNRLKKAAAHANVQIKFVRSGKGQVVFEVLGPEAAPAPRRRGRPPKAAEQPNPAG